MLSATHCLKRGSAVRSTHAPPQLVSPAEHIVVQTPAQEVYEAEQSVTVSAPPERVYLFDTDTGERLR